MRIQLYMQRLVYELSAKVHTAYAMLRSGITTVAGKYECFKHFINTFLFCSKV